jgi:type I restriction enzyme, S subunit
MIPDGWKEATIRELLNQDFLVEVQDGNHGNEHPKSSDYVKEGVPFIMARDLVGGTINFSSCSFISPEQAKNLRIGFSYPNDILLSHKGTIGEVARVPNSYDYIILTPQVTCYRVNSKANFSSDFLYQYFLSPEFQSVLKAWSSQSTRNYIGITQQKNLIIKYPPLPEQHKIAEILGAWDDAIALLEKLIAAKRKLKQGLMQQLLTGKKRFKEFEGSEWKERLISNLIKSLDAGVSVNSEDRPVEENELGILKTSAVTYGVFMSSEHKAILPDEVKRAIVNPLKDRIIISRMNTPNLVGASVYIDRDYPSLFLPDRLWQIEPRSNDFSMRWLSYILASDIYREKIASLATGTSNSMKNISKSSILKINISIPHKLEQEKIASVLSAADTEISTLEKQLAAYKQQKRGLMQQLLTGKTRVRVN